MVNTIDSRIILRDSDVIKVMSEGYISIYDNNIPDLVHPKMLPTLYSLVCMHFKLGNSTIK